MAGLMKQEASKDFIEALESFGYFTGHDQNQCPNCERIFFDSNNVEWGDGDEIQKCLEDLLKLEEQFPDKYHDQKEDGYIRTLHYGGKEYVWICECGWEYLLEQILQRDADVGLQYLYSLQQKNMLASLIRSDIVLSKPPMKKYEGVHDEDTFIRSGASTRFPDQS